QPSKLPRYLDLGYYADQGGIPFTQSSNLISALHAALKRYDSPQLFTETAELSAWLRPKLRELGFRILAPDAESAPAVFTLILPGEVSSDAVGDRLQTVGLLVSYQSCYLRKKNAIQICLMGDCSRQSLVALLSELRKTDLNPAAQR